MRNQGALAQEDLDLPADVDMSGRPMLRALLRRGGDPNALISISVRSWSSELHYSCTPLAYALTHRTPEQVQALLGHRADPNRAAGFGSALVLKPLHISAALGKLPELTSLLSHGADPNSTTSISHPGANCLTTPKPSTFVPGANFDHTVSGDTALHIAVDNRQPAVVAALLQHPSTDVNRLNSLLQSPLHKACIHNNVGLAASLAQHARIDVNRPAAAAPIFAAISTRSHALVGLLLSRGASLRVTNDKGQSPMQYLVTLSAPGFLGRADMIMQLHLAGADVNCIVQPGATALDYAVRHRWGKVQSALKSCGAFRCSDLPRQKTEVRQALPRALQAEPPAPPPDNGLCCVCLSQPAVLGFAHASVLHTCLCEGCSAALQGSGRGLRNCLICNSPASGVLRVVGT